MKIAIDTTTGWRDRLALLLAAYVLAVALAAGAVTVAWAVRWLTEPPRTVVEKTQERLPQAIHPGAL